MLLPQHCWAVVINCMSSDPQIADPEPKKQKFMALNVYLNVGKGISPSTMFPYSYFTNLDKPLCDDCTGSEQEVQYYHISFFIKFLPGISSVSGTARSSWRPALGPAVLQPNGLVLSRLAAQLPAGAASSPPAWVCLCLSLVMSDIES